MSKSSTGTRNKPYRRYLTFSLRTLFLALTALAVWLGVVVNREREQREAVKAIEALGGEVRYDWQHAFVIQPSENGYRKHWIREPSGTDWLRPLIGDDYFQDAVAIRVSGVDAVELMPHFKCLRKLKVIVVTAPLPRQSWQLWQSLKQELPTCNIHMP